MSLTMALGSFIAGATSEGGGAVAFPVMTLIFKIPAATARDFSLMIQSFGMIMATMTIFLLKIKTLPRVIMIVSLGSFCGLNLGFHYLEQVLPPVFIKMFFTSFWLSFATVLYFSLKNKKNYSEITIVNWSFKTLILFFFTGLVGGVISSQIGSGIDILTFAILTLYFKVNVKISTPTSVVLMGFTSLMGFILKNNILNIGMEPAAWDYLLVCIPIVIIGAPLGAIFINDRSKKLITYFLILSIIVQYIGSLLILPQTAATLFFSVGIFSIGVILFTTINRIRA